LFVAGDAGAPSWSWCGWCPRHAVRRCT